MRQFYVYMLASRTRVLYVGVTGDLRRRVHGHCTSTVGSTAAYHVHRLVYFETTANPSATIAREKQIEEWTRRKKLQLVAATNPRWTDLARSWCETSPSA